MSFTAAHESRHARHVCQGCRDRKARFRYRGVVRADRDHCLCFECFRSERERQRARRLVDGSLYAPLTSPFSRIAGDPWHPGAAGSGGTGATGGAGRGQALDAGRIAHRQAMLAHLERQRVASSVARRRDAVPAGRSGS